MAVKISGAQANRCIPPPVKNTEVNILPGGVMNFE
jgi:hypothetical protein